MSSALRGLLRGRFLGGRRLLSTEPPTKGRGESSHDILGTASVLAATYAGALFWVYRDYLEEGASALPSSVAADGSPAGVQTGIASLLSALEDIKTRLDKMDEMQRWMTGGCKSGPIVVVGTGGGSSQVFTYRLGPDMATLVPTAPPVEPGLNPSFVCSSGDGKVVYAAHSDRVSAFALDHYGGVLSQLGQPQSTCGAGSCYVEMDTNGTHVVVANYVGGSVAVLPVQGDGSLRPASDSKHHDGVFKPKLADRQEGPHPHSIRVEPWTGRWALVPDLGLDKCMVYEYGDGKLQGASSSERHLPMRPGAGPRHLAFGNVRLGQASAAHYGRAHPPPHASQAARDKKLVYLLNEMHSTLSVLRMDTETGKLEEEQVVSLLPYFVEPTRAGHCGSAEVAVHPSGKFLYASNRCAEAPTPQPFLASVPRPTYAANAPCSLGTTIRWPSSPSMRRPGVSA